MWQSATRTSLRPLPGAGAPTAPASAITSHRLAADDAAFKAFIERLARKRHQQGQHAVHCRAHGQRPVLSAGRRARPHATAVAQPCSYRPIGAIDVAFDRLLATERRNVTAFDMQAAAPRPSTSTAIQLPPIH